jgi:dTDP-4-dehydrorhamnose reductase
VRILLCGGGGQLGRELSDVAGAAGHTIRSTDRHDCDITNAGQVHHVLAESTPDVLINCAAWTNVDAAETHVEDAYLVNAVGPRVLAGECAKQDVVLVHLSTDYVFGEHAAAPIDERQVPQPRCVYGASKLAGEIEVRALARRHMVVRTSWLYGQDGPNFVLAMLRARERGAAVRVVNDQVGGPTWTGHLAPSLLRLVARDIPGTYHLSNAGAVSRHAFAQAIFAAAGQAAEVVPISSAEYPTPARRPEYSVLDNRAARLLGEPPMPDWSEGLRLYMARLRSNGAGGPWRYDPPANRE